MDDGRSPLPWKQRKTPKRGSRKSRNWRRIFPGYTFEGTVWTVEAGPYRRVSRHRSKSWVTVRCGDCGNSYERRLDHLVGGRSRRCNRCAPLHTQAWTHWAKKREAREKEESTVGAIKEGADTGAEPGDKSPSGDGS